MTHTTEKSPLSEKEHEIFTEAFKRCSSYIEYVCKEIAPQINIPNIECILVNMISNLLSVLISMDQDRHSNRERPLLIFSEAQLENLRNYLKRAYNVKFKIPKKENKSC